MTWKTELISYMPNGLLQRELECLSQMIRRTSQNHQFPSLCSPTFELYRRHQCRILYEAISAALNSQLAFVSALVAVSPFLFLFKWTPLSHFGILIFFLSLSLHFVDAQFHHFQCFERWIKLQFHCKLHRVLLYSTNHCTCFVFFTPSCFHTAP